MPTTKHIRDLAKTSKGLMAPQCGLAPGFVGIVADSRDMSLQPHEDLSEYLCPRCEDILLVVRHPDLARVREAAAAGHPEAIGQLALLEEGE